MISTALMRTKRVKIYTKYLKIDEDIVRRETYTDHVADSDPDPLKNTLQQIWGFIVKMAMHLRFCV